MDASLDCRTLHLASSNRSAGILKEIVDYAKSRDILIREHTREALGRLSKNKKQDQGVALDIRCPSFMSIEQFLSAPIDSATRVLALDGVTNPQNVGMIIRSAVASGIGGILYPRKGVASLGPLVIKASAGTLFKAPIISCETLAPALRQCLENGLDIVALDGAAPDSLFGDRPSRAAVYVLGGETHGVSDATRSLATRSLSIPMAGGVESLNVAVTAALIGYAAQIAP